MPFRHAQSALQQLVDCIETELQPVVAQCVEPVFQGLLHAVLHVLLARPVHHQVGLDGIIQVHGHLGQQVGIGIINVANEALNVIWTNNPAAAQATFVSTYSTEIGNLRNGGITMPLMIDGPDCGINLDVLAEVGNQLLQADPLGNLIFSAHGYWHSFANNDPAQMQTKVDQALDQGIPLVMGEVANLQDDAQMCQYTLDHNSLLNICTDARVGWLAWSWDHDGCSARQIFTNGLASNLTPYGNAIVNNPDHGLMVNTVRSAHLVLEDCGPAGIVDAMPADNGWQAVVDPGRHLIQIHGLHTLKQAYLLDLLGKPLPLAQAGSNSYRYGALPTGLYVLVVITRDGGMRTCKMYVHADA